MSDITVTTTEGGVTVVTDTLGAAAAAAAAVVSAAAAATSASNASTSASNAASSASAASTSAGTATTQAGNASTSASAAASSASAASTSASNAASSASAASTSASNASTSASTATTQAGNASTSASNASSSASAAASSAASAAASAVTEIGSGTNTAAFAAVTLAAIDRSVFAATIVDAFIYDTEKDSDGGAWRKRCAHTSWENETLSGNWLGSAANETAARLISGATTGSYYYDTTAAGFYTLNAGSGKTATYRGNVRQFPAKVLITVEAARVILWDLTQAGAPMWMVFKAGTPAGMLNWANTTATQTAAVALNGKLVTACTVDGAIFDFVRDDMRCIYGAAYAITSGRTVASRNASTTFVAGGDGYTVASIVINDVAMTVLPNAPVDVATGLPVPTIAVATAGGVSVIKGDGTVANLTTTMGSTMYYLAIHKGEVFFSPYAPSLAQKMWHQPLASVATKSYTASDHYYAYAVVPSVCNFYYDARKVSAGKSLALSGNTAVGTVNDGFRLLLANVATPASGMVSWITKDYNSGWQVGDIKGAWLADTVAETKTGGTDTDRSVKANNLTVNGSLTKAVVASGAALVGYSGFSAANYLSQAYSANLDFGTGEICIMGWLTEAPNSAIEYLFNRDSAAPGKAIRLWVSVAGYLVFELYDGTTTRTATGTVAVDNSTRLFWLATYSAGTLTIYVNGVSYATATGAALLTLTNASAVTRVGLDVAGSYPATNANLALVRAGATVPSAEQIKHIYETERPMFEANAQCCLAGTSNAITALAYDEETDLLHVGTSYGRSAFKGLVRVASEATPVGAITALAAGDGVIAQAGATGADVYVPAYNLREELARGEEHEANGIEFFDFTATASQEVFTLPAGWEIMAVYQQGAIKRETTAWVRTFDGFLWSADLVTGATVSDWVSIMARRVSK